ncbi:MAG TPA: S8 family peptidase [Blastocatellia bacterium]
MKKIVSLLMILAAISLIPARRARMNSEETDAQPLYAPDQIIVKLKPQSIEEAKLGEIFDQLLSIRAESIEKLSSADSGETGLIRLGGAMTVEDAIAEAERDPRVEYAEPNYYCYPADTMPNDPMFNQMWGLHNTSRAGVDINAPRAWDITTGADSVVVAVIDTGVDLSHADLAPNAWINPRESANGKDDDGNGYIDDINGWNFYSNNNRVFTSETADRHGTHVAGTIAAAGNNGVGVSGVAWKAKIMALKFVDSGPSSIDGAVKAINYVIDQKKHGVNVRVINASWYAAGETKTLRDAIIAAGNAGILFVCAAANGGADSVGDDLDQTKLYPPSWTDISSLMSVASVDSADRLAASSNYGHSTVSVAAPGVQILSTLPNDSYGYMSGTSMATPHVSGIAALLAADSPRLSPAQIKERIVKTAQPSLALICKVAASGRANAYGALTNMPPPPDDPVIASVRTTKKVVKVEGLNFMSGSSVIEVNGVSLSNMKYDNSTRLGNDSITRMSANIGKANVKTVFPAGVQVTVTVFDTTTGKRSEAFLFTRN